MARTLRGNLTGAAAVTQRREDRERELHPSTSVVTQQKARIDKLMQQCYAIEGDTFITWWEDDKNVPAKCTFEDQIRFLTDHLRTISLRRAVPAAAPIFAGGLS